MKNFKIAAILAAILLGLGLLAQWDEWQTKKDEERKSAERQLIKFDPANVSSIEYSNAGDDGAMSEPIEITLNKIDGSWRVTKPVQAGADQQAIENLLNTIKDYKFDKVVADTKAEWKNFGLEAPRRRVTLTTADGQKSVYVGANATIGYHTYSATSDSERVMIGSQYLAVSLSKTLHELRDKALIKIDDKAVKSLVWNSRGNPSITMTLNDKNSFDIISNGQTIAADSVEIRNTIDELNRMQVAEFIDNPDPKHVNALSGEQRFLEVIFNLADGSSKNLAFADFEGALLARGVDGPVLKLNPDSKPKLIKTLKDFRNRRIFNFESDQLAEVEIDGRSWKSVAGDWYTSEDSAKFAADGKFAGKEADKPLPATEIRALLVDLEFARAEDINPATENRFKSTLQSAPKHKIKLTYKAELAKNATTLEIWASETSDWLLRHSDAPEMVYSIKSSLLDALNPNRATPMDSGGIQDGEESAANLMETIGDLEQSGISN